MGNVSSMLNWDLFVCLLVFVVALEVTHTPVSSLCEETQQPYWFLMLDFGAIIALTCHRCPIWGEQTSVRGSSGKAEAADPLACESPVSRRKQMLSTKEIVVRSEHLPFSVWGIQALIQILLLPQHPFFPQPVVSFLATLTWVSCTLWFDDVLFEESIHFQEFFSACLSYSVALRLQILVLASPILLQLYQ